MQDFGVALLSEFRPISVLIDFAAVESFGVRFQLVGLLPYFDRFQRVVYALVDSFLSLGARSSRRRIPGPANAQRERRRHGLIESRSAGSQGIRFLMQLVHFIAERVFGSWEIVRSGGRRGRSCIIPGRFRRRRQVIFFLISTSDFRQGRLSFQSALARLDLFKQVRVILFDVLQQFREKFRICVLFVHDEFIVIRILRQSLSRKVEILFHPGVMFVERMRSRCRFW